MRLFRAFCFKIWRGASVRGSAGVLFAVFFLFCATAGAKAAVSDSAEKKAGPGAPVVATANKAEPPLAMPEKASSPEKAASKPVASKKKPTAKKGSEPAKGAGKSKPAKPPKTGAPKKIVAAPAVAEGFPAADVQPVSAKTGGNLPVAETWMPLVRRLHKDGIPMPYLRSMFGRMGSAYSHLPMGTKVTELFKNKYVPKPPAEKPGKKPETPPVYKSMLKPESVAKTKAFQEQHAAVLARMEKRFGVPGEIVAALLMVETRLGAFLGKNSAFWSLACMAAADVPQRVEGVIPTLPLPMTPDKEEWLEKLLRERSVWAYKELLALIEFSKANGLDPLAMPGSVYGAIGLCQFMPSNLPKFAVDGNLDGVIDLFEPGDAIFSVGNYLKEHGWAGTELTEKTRPGQHAALKRYNKSNVYANTILALAEALNAPATPPEAVEKATDKKTEQKRPAEAGKKSSVKRAVEKKPAGKGADAAKSTSGKKSGTQKPAAKSGEKVPQIVPAQQGKQVQHLP